LVKQYAILPVKSFNHSLGRAGDRTLSAKLIRIAEYRERKKATSNTVTLEVKRRVRLEGVELENYRARKREKEQEIARLR